MPTTISTVDGIADYLRFKAGSWFVGYTDEALVDFVLFHMQQGTLAFTRICGQVDGVMVGWRTDTTEPKMFAWEEHNPAGARWFWYFYDAVTAGAAKGLAAWFLKRHPECNTLPAMAFRHGKIRRYRPGHVLALYKKGNRYGSN